jgi:phosphoribosylglycinamide formyltransferase-1
MLSPKTKIAVAVSGQGRSLRNLLKGDYPFEVGAVICSNPKALAIEVAKEFKVPIFLEDFKNVDSEALNKKLAELDIRWIILAGFLKPFPQLRSFENRVINIHPSLLPSYGGQGMYGIRVHEAVIAAKEPYSGATIHFVNEHYDEGSIIAQAQSDINGVLTAEELAHHIFELECEFYPAVIARLLTQELPLSEGRIWHFKKDEIC